MVSRIIAMESYTPENIVTNDDLSIFVDTSDEWIYSRTGILKRRISKDEMTSDLATKVANKLILKSGINVGDIDIIIVATMSPDYLTPSTACIVQGNIGAVNAMSFDISAACSGFVYALSVADKFIKTGVYKNAIVIGAEVLSKLLNWEDRGTCVLFGDGAGGVLVSSDDEYNKIDNKRPLIIAEDISSNGSSWKSLRGGEVPLINVFKNNKNSKNNVEDKNLDNKNLDNKNNEEYFLQMNGREIFNFAIKTVPKSIQKVLDKSGENIENIKYIIPHQANSRIIDVVAKKLGIPKDKFYLNLQEYGNTSSASIPIALAEMCEKNLLQEGDKIIIVGFGAGLTWGSMILNI